MGKRILVVESGIPVVPFEQSLLLRKEHELHRASAGEEALQKIGAFQPELIVIDDKLADMKGAELAQRLRQLPECRQTAVILVSNSYEDEPPEGVNMVLRKPVVGDDFSDACEKLLSIAVRRDARLLVYVQVQGYLQSSLFLCNSINLSASGILILTARRLKLGDRVQLQITLPLEKEKVKVTGVVVREAREVSSRLNAYGVHFVEMTENETERLEKFVEEQLRRKA